MDAHPLAVNIGDPQSAYFGDPESSRIGGGDDGLVLHRPDGCKDSENFFRAENDRQGVRSFGMRNPLDDLGLFEGDVVEELEGVDVRVQRERGGLTIPNQMEEEVANLLLPPSLRETSWSGWRNGGRSASMPSGCEGCRP